VKSSYGFHIIRVDDKQDAHMKTLDEVKDQIEPVLSSRKGSKRRRSSVTRVAGQSRAEGLDAGRRENIPVM